ncbi:acyl-CoA carboxylase epsilon subunit [Gryllotalpicola protaetiae]|uniref:Acyl-CoA carboxylase subunit epsilon n=1 Tax=Gryllotalpicola protaetiae TaxID=2419771 RepID=A0A387BK77_9MICO|nr:acyl-CoA carboxylase epsilon subunit [Gryllotalpicola protaetiae]AYG04263.1 hypothetical protein D7I44_12490 [Gryllotalpicola protaetiae]
MTPRHRAAEPEQAPVDLRFVTHGLSPEEVAAATAVLTAALQQQAADARVAPERPSAWSRSTRGLRRPLRGDWRSWQQP